MNYDLKIFTENIEPEAGNQIYELIRTAPFEKAKVWIMPASFGPEGIWGSAATSDVVAITLTVFCIVKYRKRYHCA